MVNRLNVEFILNSKVVRIHKDGIEYQNNDEVNSIKDIDYIILAFGSKPNNKLYKELKGVHVIGDASKAGDAKKAIFEATELALKL